MRGRSELWYPASSQERIDQDGGNKGTVTILVARRDEANRARIPETHSGSSAKNAPTDEGGSEGKKPLQACASYGVLRTGYVYRMYSVPQRPARRESQSESQSQVSELP